MRYLLAAGVALALLAAASAGALVGGNVRSRFMPEHRIVKRWQRGAGGRRSPMAIGVRQ